MDYLSLHLAVGATERHVLSARPDAPVRDDQPRPVRLARIRQVTAGALHHIADRITPERTTRPAPVGSPQVTRAACSA
ncbi:hypothetical protein [Plantactinospora sp. B5E13]|uniref:hypothetical protein n=1 Tax=unclassified Plantactinospora TaxID=2631981 RepID=UPI00325DEB0A